MYKIFDYRCPTIILHNFPMKNLKIKKNISERNISDFTDISLDFY